MLSILTAGFLIILCVIQWDTMYVCLDSFFRRSQPFCSVGFPVRVSARASSVNCCYS